MTVAGAAKANPKSNPRILGGIPAGDHPRPVQGVVYPRLEGGGRGAKPILDRGGRCDWINDEAGLGSAVTYVLEVQDRKGRDEAP